MSQVLLLGAGFSKNWGGWLSREVFGDLAGRVQHEPCLLDLLNRSASFEDALADLQHEYISSGSDDARTKLNDFQHALRQSFGAMNAALAKKQFEFQNDKSMLVRTFLLKFDAIFSLNQDLLAELHYLNDKVQLESDGKWNGWEMPGTEELSNATRSGSSEPLYARRRPVAGVFARNPSRKMQPFFKLHGSMNWVDRDGQDLMVMGGNKAVTIQQHPLLKWYQDQFLEYLSKPGVRLMIVGYSFLDAHINDLICEAWQRSGKTLTMFIIDPEGRDVLRKVPSSTRPLSVPLPIEKVMVAGESRRPLSAIFGGVDLAEFGKVNRFALAGDARGMAELGYSCEHGEGGQPKDYVQAVHWYREAANAGDARAMAFLGHMYERGLGGLPPDQVQAVHWYRKAADAGDARGMALLCLMYGAGKGGLPKDNAQVMRWMRKAAEAGDPPSMLTIGISNAEGVGRRSADDTQAVSWFRKAAGAGSSKGMCCLGVMYACGRGGLPKDGAQAVSCYRKAAAAGSARAMAYLGVMYESGLGGLQKDELEAVSWYRKAADAGSARGMALLGLMYLDGRGGLLKDYARGVSWLRKAAQNDSYARNVLRRLGLRRFFSVLQRSGVWPFLVALRIPAGIAALSILPFNLFERVDEDWMASLVISSLLLLPFAAGFGSYAFFRRPSGAQAFYLLAGLESAFAGVIGGGSIMLFNMILCFGLGRAVGWRRDEDEKLRAIGGQAISIM